MTYWLFQHHPQGYRVKEAIADFAYLSWPVERFAKKMQPGDGVLLAIAGGEFGIYGIGDLVAKPCKLKEPWDRGYWLTAPPAGVYGRLHLNYRFLHHPLTKGVILGDPILGKLKAIGDPGHLNYKISPKQWRRVFELLF